MRKGLFLSMCFILSGMFSTPCLAEKAYRIDVLQVTSIPPYQSAYMGFVSELEKNGIVQGKNLTIKRTVIDVGVKNPGLWRKFKALIRIKHEVSRIAEEKPDLVLTIGTSATRHAKDGIVDEGIPLVFTAVANPVAAGCTSMTEAGPGVTGATLHANMTGLLGIVKQAFPKVNTLGIIHSDEDNAVAQAQEATKEGRLQGLTFLTRQVSRNDHITPAAEELIARGAQAFVIPLDTYYAVRNYEPCRELAEVSKKFKTPNISFVLLKIPGSVLYLGTDFGDVGRLSGRQAVKILKEGVKAETLPIAQQQEPSIMVDEQMIQALDLQIPGEVLKGAKSITQ